MLNFISDEELRRTIHAATNTVESWNGFVQWVAFGGDGIIRQNHREEQRKIIRYNHMVANLVLFHNVVSMTRGLPELVDEGCTVTPEIVARLPPYKTVHINQFGNYERHFDQVPSPMTEELKLSPVAVSQQMCRRSVSLHAATFGSKLVFQKGWQYDSTYPIRPNS